MNETQARKKIVEILKDMWDRGHVNTTGVSVSYRLDDSRILVDQSGTAFRKCRISEDDLLIIDINCNLVETAPNSPERKAPVNTIIHTEYYKANPLARACVHCHPRYSQVFACRNESIFPYTLQSHIIGEVPCVFVDDALLKKDFFEKNLNVEIPSGLHSRPDVFYVMQKVADEVVHVLSGREKEMEKHGLAVNHFEHGIFVFGRNLDEAFDNLERVEANAHVTIMSKMLDK